MKKILLNQLRLERLEKLSIKEKGKIVKSLRDKYKLSYRKMEELTGIPHSTLLDWVTGRQENSGIHISIDRLINYFKDYKPKLSEFEKLEELKKIIENILNYGQRN